MPTYETEWWGDDEWYDDTFGFDDYMDIVMDAYAHDEYDDPTDDTFLVPNAWRNWDVDYRAERLEHYAKVLRCGHCPPNRGENDRRKIRSGRSWKLRAHVRKQFYAPTLPADALSRARFGRYVPMSDATFDLIFRRK